MTIAEARAVQERPDIATSQPEWEVRPEHIGKSAAYYQTMLNQVDRARRAQDYREYTPCGECTWCAIMREMRLGQIVNTAYVCTRGRFAVSSHGTCHDSHLGKRGPMVIVKVLEGDTPRTDYHKAEIPDFKTAMRMEKKQLEELGYADGE